MPFSTPDDATKFPSVQRTIFPELRLLSRTGFAVAPENPVPTPAGGGSGVSTMALSVRLHPNCGGPHCVRNGAARAVVTNKKKHMGKRNRTTIWVSNHRAESQPSRCCCQAASTWLASVHRNVPFVRLLRPFGQIRNALALLNGQRGERKG